MPDDVDQLVSDTEDAALRVPFRVTENFKLGPGLDLGPTTGRLDALLKQFAVAHGTRLRRVWVSQAGTRALKLNVLIDANDIVSASHEAEQITDDIKTDLADSGFTVITAGAPLPLGSTPNRPELILQGSSIAREVA
ncbi:hypothetical protein GCM10022288_15820 [Gryllotalpicola kribbensis]|uniref:Uncharacterized protein n=1 Tax=Gryllotalpicola kribbensis TaxID=993084 RepID=A0ABP8ASD1_9MICO